MTYPPQDPQNPYTPAQPPYDPTQSPAQPQYGQPQSPAAPQYGQPQYGQQPYEAPQSPAQPQYGQPQYGQQPYDAPQSPAQPQYGQPQYGQQQYEPTAQQQYYQPGQQPQQGYQTPYQQPYGQPELPQKTNGFAIASLILGIIGGTLLAIIFGVVALSQIKKRNEKGKGMAVTGIVLAVVWILGCGGLIAAGALSDGFNFGQAPRDDKGTITDSGDVSAKSIKLGDCVNDLEEGTVDSLKAVPCAQPHDAEVYAEFSLTGSTYPGETKVTKDAEDGCSTRFETAIAAKYLEDESIGIYYLYPSQETWTRGDRVVSCFAEDTDGQLTGSVRK